MISSVVGKFSGSERILSRLERFSSPLSTSCTGKIQLNITQQTSIMESCRFWTRNKSNMAAETHVAVTFPFCQVNNAVEALEKNMCYKKLIPELCVIGKVPMPCRGPCYSLM
jgi:hypothetical protein